MAIAPSLVEVDAYPLGFRASPPVVSAGGYQHAVVALVDLDRQAAVVCEIDDRGALGEAVSLEIEYPTGVVVADEDVVVTGALAGAAVITRFPLGGNPRGAATLPIEGAVLRAPRPITTASEVRVVWETFSARGSTLWACTLGGALANHPFPTLSAHLETGGTGGGITVARVSGPDAAAAVLWFDADLQLTGLATVAEGASGIGLGTTVDELSCVCWSSQHGSQLWARWFWPDAEPVGEPLLVDAAPPSSRAQMRSIRVTGGPRGCAAVLHRCEDAEGRRATTEDLTVVSVDNGVAGRLRIAPPSAGGRAAAWTGSRVVVLPGGELDLVRVYEMK